MSEIILKDSPKRGDYIRVEYWCGRTMRSLVGTFTGRQRVERGTIEGQIQCRGRKVFVPFDNDARIVLLNREVQPEEVTA